MFTKSTMIPPSHSFLPKSITSSLCAPSRTQCLLLLRQAHTSSAHDFGSRRSSSNDPELPWPSNANPTPYEILSLAPNASYSKSRFNQLVKVYHPDVLAHRTSSLRHDPTVPGAQFLAPSTLLDRYRLIVLAHAILSDPERRRLYDQCGFGWGSQSIHQSGYPYYSRESYRAWRDGPLGGAAHNATWEDWERWYAERRSPGKNASGPLYMSHFAFAMSLTLIVIIAAMLQGVGVSMRENTMSEERKERNADLSHDLRIRAAGIVGLDREAQFEKFLRDRENLAWKYKPDHYDHETRRITREKEVGE